MTEGTIERHTRRLKKFFEHLKETYNRAPQIQDATNINLVSVYVGKLRGGQNVGTVANHIQSLIVTAKYILRKVGLTKNWQEIAEITQLRHMQAQLQVDTEALQQQCAERDWVTNEEQRRNDAFAKSMIRNDKICVLLQKRQEEDLRKLSIKLNEFRKTYQTPDSSKEWDLNDPKAKNKDAPARISDDDPRCGVSSMQKFLGEDLSGKERKKIQQEQTREWCKQQMMEKVQNDANMKQAKHLYDLKSIENEQRALELARAEQECKRAINMATKEFNKALHDEKSARLELEKQKELDDSMTEISNNVFGDMLTENPAVAQSAFGSHRVIPDRWKGMSPAEINRIRDIQNDQIQEKKRLEERERQQNEAWDKKRIAEAKAALVMEKQQQKLIKDLEKQNASENLRLSAEQKAHSDYIKREVYTNQPTAAFFDQFNRSSR